MTFNHLKKTMQHQEMEYIITLSPARVWTQLTLATLTVSGADPHAETNVTGLGFNQFVFRVQILRV